MMICDCIYMVLNFHVVESNKYKRVHTRWYAKVTRMKLKKSLSVGQDLSHLKCPSLQACNKLCVPDTLSIRISGFLVAYIFQLLFPSVEDNEISISRSSIQSCYCACFYSHFFPYTIIIASDKQKKGRAKEKNVMDELPPSRKKSRIDQIEPHCASVFPSGHHLK